MNAFAHPPPYLSMDDTIELSGCLMVMTTPHRVLCLMHALQAVG